MTDDHAVRIAVLEERSTAMREAVLTLRKDVDDLERARTEAKAVARSATDAAVRRLVVVGLLVAALGVVANVVTAAVWG